MKRRTFAILTMLILTLTVGANIGNTDINKENGQASKPENRVLSDIKGQTETQDSNQKLTKKQRKQLKELQDIIDHSCAMEAMDSMNFVLKADRLVSKRGHTVYVNDITNFISVSGDYATVQIAPSYSGGGPNGVGGITLDGKVSNVKYDIRKNGNKTLSMNVMGSVISATLFIELYDGGNNAEVTVTSNFHSLKVTLMGTLTPTDDTYIYKGTSY